MVGVVLTAQSGLVVCDALVDGGANVDLVGGLLDVVWEGRVEEDVPRSMSSLRPWPHTIADTDIP